MAGKTKVITLKSELYPHKVVFCIGPRPADSQVGRIAIREKLWTGEGRTPTVGDGGAGTCTFSSGSIVWLDPNSDRFLANFAHELVHVLNGLSEHIGEQQSYMHDELFAYYAGWLTNELFKRVKTSP